MLPFLSLLPYYLKKAHTVVKRTVLVIVVFTVILSLFGYFLNKSRPQANTKDTIKNYQAEVFKKVSDESFKDTEEDQLKADLAQTITCKVVGVACTDNPADSMTHFEGSLMASLTTMISTPFSAPPASGIYWAYDGLEKAGLVPKTYAAQGIGFAALSPFQNIWVMFRNLVFMMLVLVIVAMGFMIMFRSKMGGKAALTIESALPKIVIALLLVTFSYAIAGFMIDVMYISLGLIISLFGTNEVLQAQGLDAAKLFNMYYFNSDASVWEALNPVGTKSEMILSLSTTMYGLLPSIVRGVLNNIGALLGMRVILMVIGAVAGLAPGSGGVVQGAGRFKLFDLIARASKGIMGIFGTADAIHKSGTIVISLIAGIVLVLLDLIISAILGPMVMKLILGIIFLLSIVYIYIRIFFMLILTYINILLLIFFSPVIIMFEAIPGQSTFATWLKTLAVHLSTFPIFVMLTLVVQILLNTNAAAGELWRPPFLFNIEGEAFQVLVAMFIFYSIPDLVKQLKQMTGVKPMGIDINYGAMFAGTAALTGLATLPNQLSSLSNRSFLVKSLMKDTPLEKISKAGSSPQRVIVSGQDIKT